MRSFVPRSALAAACAVALSSSEPAAAQPKRHFDFDDLAAIRQVGDAQLSPEGEWVAYVVRTTDVEEDAIQGDLWMTRWDGSRTLQLTFTDTSESRPRFSPDGRYLAFLTARDDEADGQDGKSQVWLMERAGGEARELTSFPGGVSDYVWSPDGSKLAVIASDPDPEDEADEDETPAPIVIDRYQFKADRVGYLRHFRDHLYLFDVASESSEQLTSGDYDDALPSFSPDGKLIAFSSKRTGDPDRNDNWDVFLVEARAGAVPRKLTDYEGADDDTSWGSPAAFSPDGTRIAYLRGGPPEDAFYDQPEIVVMPVEGGASRVVHPDLDRWVSSPTWSADGESIYFLLEDDRSRVVARVPAGGGEVERLGTTPGVTSDFSLGKDGRLAAVFTSPHAPAEVFAVTLDGTRPLSTQNTELLAELELGEVEGIELESRDGTIVHGLLVKPPGYVPGRRYPTIAYIHGGPVSQDAFEFDTIWQILAAKGYVVVAPNYRGSSGRGKDYSLAIKADWGHLEVQDVLATVDHAVAEGIADPERLGIGGWSYGGMTTNYTIATDTRFKAAVSGAGVSNMLAAYGTDQYIRQYEQEIGLPWVDVDAYLHVSFPFYHANEIRTPTLFLCGEKDFNVPLINSEQMYQALVSLGVETQLVIYPGQYHGLAKPSYQRDRLERYVAWFDRFLKPGTTD